VKNIKPILSVSAFAFATVTAIGGNLFVATGWGKFPTHTILRPINGGPDCLQTCPGVICTVTDNITNPITVTAYDSQANANIGGTIGVLRRCP